MFYHSVCLVTCSICTCQAPWWASISVCVPSRTAFHVSYNCSFSSKPQSTGHKSDLEPAFLELFDMIRIFKVQLLSLGGEPYFGIVSALLCHKLNWLLMSLGILATSVLGAESTSMLTWSPTGITDFLLQGGNQPLQTFNLHLQESTYRAHTFRTLHELLMSASTIKCRTCPILSLFQKSYAAR